MIDPNFYDAIEYNKQGITLMQQRNYQDASDCFTEALKYCSLGSRSVSSSSETPAASSEPSQCRNNINRKEDETRDVEFMSADMVVEDETLPSSQECQTSGYDDHDGSHTEPLIQPPLCDIIVSSSSWPSRHAHHDWKARSPNPSCSFDEGDFVYHDPFDIRSDRIFDQLHGRFATITEIMDLISATVVFNLALSLHMVTIEQMKKASTSSRGTSLPAVPSIWETQFSKVIRLYQLCHRLVVDHTDEANLIMICAITNNVGQIHFALNQTDTAQVHFQHLLRVLMYHVSIDAASGTTNNSNDDTLEAEDNVVTHGEQQAIDAFLGNTTYHLLGGNASPAAAA